MASALVLADDGRRENGRWRRGSVQVGNDESVNSGWSQRLKEAGIVLDFAPDLASRVAGELTLNAAFGQADEARRSAEADKLAEKARRRQEAEEAKRLAERDAQLTEKPITALSLSRFANAAATPSPRAGGDGTG